MAIFVQVKNGFVNGSVVAADIAAAKENLRAFINTSIQDYGQKTNPFIYLEILKASRVLLGEDFRSFLIANHKNGLGPCSSLMMAIVHYLNGNGSTRTIIMEIRRAEEIVSYNNSTPGAWDNRFIVKQKTADNSRNLGLLDNVSNFDYYRLLRGIGIPNLSSLLLVLLGEQP